MSRRSRDVMSGMVKTIAFGVLSFLLSTGAGEAAAVGSAFGQPPQTPGSTSTTATLALLYIPSAYLPSAGRSVRDAPFYPRSPPSKHMPAPAATNHYAGLVAIRI